MYILKFISYHIKCQYLIIIIIDKTIEYTVLL